MSLYVTSIIWSTNKIWSQIHKHSNTFFKCKITLCADHKLSRVTIWSSLVTICFPWGAMCIFRALLSIVFKGKNYRKNFCFSMMKIKESLKDTKQVLKSVLFSFKGYILQEYPPRRVTIFQTFLRISAKIWIELVGGMVDRWKTFSLISSRDHCQRSSPSRISDMPQAGFEPVQNLSSGFVEWSCSVVITTTPWRLHYITAW